MKSLRLNVKDWSSRITRFAFVAVLNYIIPGTGFLCINQFVAGFVFLGISILAVLVGSATTSFCDYEECELIWAGAMMTYKGMAAIAAILSLHALKKDAVLEKRMLPKVILIMAVLIAAAALLPGGKYKFQTMNTMPEPDGQAGNAGNAFAFDAKIISCDHLHKVDA